MVQGGRREEGSGGLGAGFAWHGISLDVSYLTASETIGGSWMAGLGYRF